MPGSEIDISVVVPTYNDAPRLRNLLDSFEKVAYPRPFEVILVDDCSTDDTEAAGKAWEAVGHAYAAHYVRLAQNGGPGRARNEGLHRARGRLVAFTDSDCRVHPDWLSRLAEGIDAPRRIVGAGGRVRAVSDRSLVARHFVFHRVLEPPKSLAYLVTCNCCYLREPLLGIGGFPSDIRNPGGEDVAVSILLWKQGWRFASAEGAIIEHDFSPSLRSFYKTWYHYGYGSGRVLHQLLDPVELRPSRDHAARPEHWPGFKMRPPMHLWRGLLGDIGYELGKCRHEKLGAWRTVEMIALTLIRRVAYQRGWRRAEAEFSGQPPRSKG